MTPLANFQETDADANLGYALGVSAMVRDRIHGVRVPMNVQLFHPDSVQKNEPVGRFEALSPGDEPIGTDRIRERVELDDETFAEIERLEFLGFDPIDSGYVSTDNTVRHRTSRGLIEALPLTVNSAACASTLDLIEEARDIALVLDRTTQCQVAAVCFEAEDDWRGRGFGTFVVWQYQEDQGHIEFYPAEG